MVQISSVFSYCLVNITLNVLALMTLIMSQCNNAFSAHCDEQNCSDALTVNIAFSIRLLIFQGICPEKRRTRTEIWQAGAL